jgi:multiple sugar transport system permease protein
MSASTRSTRSMRSGTRLAGQAGFYVTGAALAILFLFPLVWSGWSSVQGQPGSGQATGYGFGNYARMFSFGEGVPTYFTNSVLISVMTVAGTLLVSTLGGYGFARFDFPGKNLLFLATLAILMVPYATILIPLYVMLGWMGLQNSLFGLSLVLVMFQLPFALFMMRNSFEALPRELEEAALVDGCTTFSALRRILLHGVRPGLVTVGLFAFLASWNDFFAPLILITESSRFPLPVAVYSMTERTFGAIDYGALEAGVMTMAVPSLLLFLVLQRHYVRGFMSGAVRG